MSEMIRNLVNEQQNLVKEAMNVAIENQKLMQKQVDMAMDSSRASMEMARDLSQSATKMWTDAVLPKKGEA